MKESLYLKVLAFVVAGLLLSAAQSFAEQKTEKSKSMNVMSWNIRYNNLLDGVNAWKHRKDWVAEIIIKQKVDIAGLQEVRLEQLNDLKKRLPEMDVYGVGRDDGKTRGEHTPIFYRNDRFELLDKGTFWLSKTPEKVASRDWDAAITRIVSWVKLKDKNTNALFYFINTHFDHRGKVAREESAKLILEQVKKKFSDHPVILTGDFNTTPDTLAYKTLIGNEKKETVFHDALTQSEEKPTGPDSTWNGFRAIIPKRRIDFIFVTKKVKVLQHRILDEQREKRFPSDHLAVWTKMELTK